MEGLLLRLGIGAVLVAAFAGLAWRLDSTSKDLAAANKLAVTETARADASAEASKLLAAAAVSNKKIEQDVAALRRDMRASVRDLQMEIASAPPEDDAPLSPSMLRTLDRLRQLHANAAAADADRVPEDGDSGRAK